MTSRAAAAEPAAPVLTPSVRAIVDATGATGETRRLLEIRVPDLVAYQNEAYAKQYADFVAMVWKKERTVGADTALSAAVARYLYKLMAYKDEYEVARLALDPEARRGVGREFRGWGGDELSAPSAGVAGDGDEEEDRVGAVVPGGVPVAVRGAGASGDGVRSVRAGQHPASLSGS